MGVNALVRETIKIEGMACNHCVMRDKTDLVEIKAVVREAGYEPA